MLLVAVVLVAREQHVDFAPGHVVLDGHTFGCFVCFDAEEGVLELEMGGDGAETLDLGAGILEERT